jgi:hypothetical protein
MQVNSLSVVIFMKNVYLQQLIETYVGFEFLTAVGMKSSIFWDITPCNPMKVNRRFEGTCRLHLQDRRISQARKQHEARICSKQG